MCNLPLSPFAGASASLQQGGHWSSCGGHGVAPFGPLYHVDVCLVGRCLRMLAHVLLVAACFWRSKECLGLKTCLETEETEKLSRRLISWYGGSIKTIWSLACRKLSGSGSGPCRVWFQTKKKLSSHKEASRFMTHDDAQKKKIGLNVLGWHSLSPWVRASLQTWSKKINSSDVKLQKPAAGAQRPEEMLQWIKTYFERTCHGPGRRDYPNMGLLVSPWNKRSTRPNFPNLACLCGLHSVRILRTSFSKLANWGWWTHSRPQKVCEYVLHIHTSKSIQPCLPEFDDLKQ